MRIAVVGDLLLDVDVVGTSTRRSPDGDAPVVEIAERRVRAGGAGLVASLLAADGHSVRLISALGSDEDAETLRAALPAGAEAVLGASGTTTPVKTRIRANGGTVARLDAGCASSPPPPAIDDAMRAALDDVDGIVVADYGRGMSAAPAIRDALAAAVGRIPVVWDPHPRGALPVPGVEVATPNLDEAGRFTALALADESDGEAAARAGRLLRQRWRSRAVAVTLGARGVLLSGDTDEAIPAPAVRVPDSCGAGDRLASAVTAALAGGIPLGHAVTLAVEVTADFLRRGGVATV